MRHSIIAGSTLIASFFLKKSKTRAARQAFALSVKYVQNRDSFSCVLVSTGDRVNLEYFAKDSIGDTMPNDRYLVGTNALGRLLMQLMEEYVINCRLLPEEGGIEEKVEQNGKSEERRKQDESYCREF